MNEDKRFNQNIRTADLKGPGDAGTSVPDARKTPPVTKDVPKKDVQKESGR